MTEEVRGDEPSLRESLDDRVIHLAERNPNPYQVPVTLLTEDRPNGEIKIRRGEELFVVAAGKPIIRPGYVGPDEVYTIGAEIADGQWPVLLCRVQKRHAAQWVGLGVETANRMVARARGRLSDLPPLTPGNRKDGSSQKTSAETEL